MIDRLGKVVRAEWNSHFRVDDYARADENYDADSSKKFDARSVDTPGRRVSDIESAYRVLELTPGASLDEVRAAYREMALRYHPRTLSERHDQAFAAQTLLEALTDALEFLEAHLLPLAPSESRAA